MSIRRIAQEVNAGDRAAASLIEGALASADANASVGAIWFLDRDGSAKEAASLDASNFRDAHRRPLAGIPILVKDAIDVERMPGGAGGPVRVAARDAVVVSRCRKAGAIVLGKTAMHQLGWGMSGQCPGRPTCMNPALPGHQPGGSSSGSAAAVAAGVVQIALGADSGGSVRLPAAWCGVVGFKPKQADLSRRGLAPLARPLDTVGYLGRTVDDCQVAHEALADFHPPDSNPSLKGIRVACDGAFMERAAPEVMEGFCQGLDALRDAGVNLIEEHLPPHRLPLGALYAAALAEEWGEIVEANPDVFGADVKAGVERGRTYDPVDIAKAWASRERLRRSAALRADAFASPAVPVLAPSLEATDDVATAGAFLRPFNVLDWPAIVVPATRALPSVGFQLAAPPGSEHLLFLLAKVVEARQ